MNALVSTSRIYLYPRTLTRLTVASEFRFPPRQSFIHSNGGLSLEFLGFRPERHEFDGEQVNVSVGVAGGDFSGGVENVGVGKVKVKISNVGGEGRKAARERGVVKSTVNVETAPFAEKSFVELGLPGLLVEGLARAGVDVPTDVQSMAIPTILDNHDVVVQSYTGSGKTLAYVLPILAEVGPLRKSRIRDGEGDERGKKGGVEAVVVAPSRELAMQIVREIENLLGRDKRMVQQLVGGANRSRQEEALKKNKPVIVVGTPGRLAEISSSGRLPTHGCRFLVLDEVDELLSFNFREDMHRILEHVGKKGDRRLVMVSATLPFSVVRAARGWGKNPLLVRAKEVLPLDSVPSSGPISLSGSTTNNQVSTVESLPPSLKHFYCLTKSQHKVDMLRRCVHALDAKYVIAFMNHTKRLKDAVHKLEARGIKAAELHGDLGKLGRSTVLKKFKAGDVRVLVTNELSARGLDVSECDLVVNLDLPTDSVHYAHRAGRAGRLGRKGSVITVCEDSEVFIVKKMEKQLGVSIQICEFTDGKLVVSAKQDARKVGGVESYSGRHHQPVSKQKNQSTVAVAR